MAIAINPKTGEAVLWDGNDWVPTKTATNPKTGESVAWNGFDWEKFELPEQPSGFGAALSSGTDILQKGLYSALEGGAKSLGLEDLAQFAGEGVARNEAEASAALPTPQSFGEAQSVGDYFTAAKEALGTSLPSMAPAAAGALAGAGLGSIVPGLGTTVGALIGGTLGGIPGFYGSNREAQKDVNEGVVKSEGAAILAAVPQAVMDSILTLAFPGLGKAVGGGLLTRVVKKGAEGIVEEVPTEIGQQILERYQAGKPIADEEAINEYREVAIAAGVLGGGLGGVGGALQKRVQEPAPVPQTPADLAEHIANVRANMPGGGAAGSPAGGPSGLPSPPSPAGLLSQPPGPAGLLPPPSNFPGPFPGEAPPALGSPNPTPPIMPPSSGGVALTYQPQVDARQFLPQPDLIERLAQPEPPKQIPVEGANAPQVDANQQAAEIAAQAQQAAEVAPQEAPSFEVPAQPQAAPEAAPEAVQQPNKLVHWGNALSRAASEGKQPSFFDEITRIAQSLTPNERIDAATIARYINNSAYERTNGAKVISEDEALGFMKQHPLLSRGKSGSFRRSEVPGPEPELSGPNIDWEDLKRRREAGERPTNEEIITAAELGWPKWPSSKGYLVENYSGIVEDLWKLGVPVNSKNVGTIADDFDDEASRNKGEIYHSFYRNLYAHHSGKPIPIPQTSVPESLRKEQLAGPEGDMLKEAMRNAGLKSGDTVDVEALLNELNKIRKGAGLVEFSDLTLKDYLSTLSKISPSSISSSGSGVREKFFVGKVGEADQETEQAAQQPAAAPQAKPEAPSAVQNVELRKTPQRTVPERKDDNFNTEMERGFARTLVAQDIKKTIKDLRMQPGDEIVFKGDFLRRLNQISGRPFPSVQQIKRTLLALSRVEPETVSAKFVYKNIKFFVAGEKVASEQKQAVPEKKVSPAEARNAQIEKDIAKTLLSFHYDGTAAKGRHSPKIVINKTVADAYNKIAAYPLKQVELRQSIAKMAAEGHPAIQEHGSGEGYAAAPGIKAFVEGANAPEAKTKSAPTQQAGERNAQVERDIAETPLGMGLDGGGPEITDNPLQTASNVYAYLLAKGTANLPKGIKPSQWEEQMRELVENPSRYHPVRENAASGYKIGDRVTLAKDPYDLLPIGKAGARGDAEAYVVTIVPQTGKNTNTIQVASDSGYPVFYSPDDISPYNGGQPQGGETFTAENVVNNKPPEPGTPPARHLIFMPCSQTKAEGKDIPARKLYKGVFFQTLESNIPFDNPNEPQVLILSAKHGVIRQDRKISPYDQKMDKERADELIADINFQSLAAYRALTSDLTKLNWNILLVGGKEYQRVMREIIARLKNDGVIGPDVGVMATSGEIGEQRAQLGAYVRGMYGEAERAAPAKEAAAPKYKAPVQYDEATVEIPTGGEIDVRYEIVELDSLKQAKGELQNRDRSRSSYEAVLADMYSKFNPKRLGKDDLTDRGAPVVGDDDIIDSGNGRALLLGKVYDGKDEAAIERQDAYKAFLEKSGYDLDGFEKPVLIRRRLTKLTPEGRRNLVIGSNKDVKAGLSTTERSGTDADALTPSVMELYRGGDINSAANREFVGAFLKSIPANERGNFTTKGLELSADGARRIRSAIKALAYDDVELLNTLDEAIDNDIKSIGTALEDVAGRWAQLRERINVGEVRPDFDVTKQLVEAAKILRDIRRDPNANLKSYLEQQDMFSPKDPVVISFLKMFHAPDTKANGEYKPASQKSIVEGLNKFVNRALEQSTAPDLFGKVGTLTPDKLINDINAERENKSDQGNMFASVLNASLPRKLAGAKPRYGFGKKNFPLAFESDFGKALYIAYRKQNPYREWLISQGIADKDIDLMGKDQRDNIKFVARELPSGQALNVLDSYAEAAPAGAAKATPKPKKGANAPKQDFEEEIAPTSGKRQAEAAPAPQPVDPERLKQSRAVVKKFLQDMIDRGDRNAAMSALKAIKDRGLSDAEVHHYLLAMDIASRMLGPTKINPIYMFTNKVIQHPQAGKAAAIAVPPGKSKKFMEGLVAFSLEPSSRKMIEMNAFHEAFHILQGMMEAHDPKTAKIISNAFRKGMTLDDVDPSIKRTLQNATHSDGKSYWDFFKGKYDTMPNLRSEFAKDYEASAYMFGLLADAKRNNQNMNALLPAFKRFVNFIDQFKQRMGNALRGLGYRSVEDVFNDYIAGRQQRGYELRNNAITGGGARASVVGAEGVRNKENFKRWAGNTVVVDENGEPAIVYHGTKDRISEFIIGHPNQKDAGYLGKGVYFTNNTTMAKMYAEYMKKGAGYPNIIPAYIRIEKPYYASNEERTALKNAVDAGDFEASERFTRKLQALGHDGVIFEHIGGDKAREYVIFDTNQAKSAFNQFTDEDVTGPALSVLMDDESAHAPEIREGVATVMQGANTAARSAVGNWQKVKTIAKSLFDPLAKLPNTVDYLVMRYRLVGRIDELEDEARGFHDTMKKATKEQSEAIFEYLTTRGAAVPNLPAELRDVAVTVKRRIKEIGIELSDPSVGILSPQSVAMYEDKYLPRLYMKYLLEEKGLISTGPRMGLMEYARQRTDVDEETRVALGEVKDPGFASFAALYRPQRDMAVMKFLKGIAEASDKDWVYPNQLIDWKGAKVTAFWLADEANNIRERMLFEPDAAKKATMARVADDMQRLAADNVGEVPPQNYKRLPKSNRYGALKGLAVREEIYNDLISMGGFDPDPNLVDKLFGDKNSALAKGTQFWKMSKTILNPPTQIRQIISNAVMLNLSGVPLHRVPYRMLQAMDAIKNDTEVWKKAKEYGIKGAGFGENELREATNLLREYLAENSTGIMNPRKLMNIVAKVTGKAGDFYQYTDQVFKLAKIIDEVERKGIARMPEGAAKERAYAEAALQGHKWFFDYSLVHRGIKSLRTMPFGAPFITYYYKALPLIVEVATNPRTAMRFAPYIALMAAMPAMVASMYDVDDEDVDKLKMSLSEKLREKPNMLIFPFKDQNGNWQFLDWGYFFPWAMFVDTGRALAKGDVVGALGTVGALTSPALSIASAIKTNVDPFTGRQIINEYDPPKEKMMAFLSYVNALVMPPIVTSYGAFGKAIEAATNSGVNRYGEPNMDAIQITARAMGFNFYPVVPELQRARNIRRMDYEIQMVKSNMTQSLKDRSLTPEKREAIRKDFLEELARRRAARNKYIQDSAIPAELASGPRK